MALIFRKARTKELDIDEALKLCRSRGCAFYRLGGSRQHEWLLIYSPASLARFAVSHTHSKSLQGTQGGYQKRAGLGERSLRDAPIAWYNALAFLAFARISIRSPV